MGYAATPASQILARQQFSEQRVLFAGDLQDDYPATVAVAARSIWCTQYHYYRALNVAESQQKYFALLPDADTVQQCDLVIYYWPKSKREAQFQLQAILAHLKADAVLWIVGENRSGVRSVESLLAPLGHLQKIDSARRCSLYQFVREQRVQFDLANWWQHYSCQDAKICTLPGVFSAAQLDAGSELLLATLLKQPDLLQGEMLDVGCGAGVLSAVLGKASDKLKLTLCDTSAAAVISSQATLQANQLQGKVISSDIFSDISARYDLIISNPPFHDGRQTDYVAVTQLITQAAAHLNRNGKLCLVANAFLPYPELLDNTFGQHQVIAQNSRYKVYLATRQAAK